jgi:hypothetical protein
MQNSPFTTAAVNISNFPGSVRTSHRRLRNSELVNFETTQLLGKYALPLGIRRQELDLLRALSKR